MQESMMCGKVINAPVNRKEADKLYERLCNLNGQVDDLLDTLFGVTERYVVPLPQKPREEEEKSSHELPPFFWNCQTELDLIELKIHQMKQRLLASEL